MSVTRRSAHMNVMVEAAEKAGRGLVRDFGEVENLQVSKKGPGDFVSAADHKAEKIVMTVLNKARPTYDMLLEESGEKKGTDRTHRWIVDPLDGTTNFLHGIPHWCVSIAFEKDKEIVAGVIFDPIKNELFTAEKGTGAFMNDKRLRVSARTVLSEALVSVGVDQYKKNPAGSSEQRDVSGMLTRRTGSACLDLAYVAAGRFDGYWEYGLKPWDSAAGSLIVKEAGGYVSDVDGTKDYIYGHSILAANQAIHGLLLKKLKSSDDKNAQKVKSAS